MDKVRNINASIGYFVGQTNLFTFEENHIILEKIMLLLEKIALLLDMSRISFKYLKHKSGHGLALIDFL